jgi:hypothetical protein
MVFLSGRELGMSASLFMIQDPTELCESTAVGSTTTRDPPVRCGVVLC